MTVDMWRSVVDGGLVVLIVLVQWIIYPSFRHIAVEAFAEWHEAYTRRITIIVMPLMLAQVGLITTQIVRSPEALHVISAIFVGLAWLSTFCMSVPCHQRLRADDRKSIERLIITNVWRTTAWSVTFLFGLLDAAFALWP